MGEQFGPILSTSSGGGGGGGTVTSVSGVNANGLTVSVTNPTTTPAITVGTSINSPVLAGNGTAITAATTTGSGSTVVLATSPTLTTPNLDTPSAVTLTNATGLPLTTAVTGTLPVANGGTGVTTSTGSGNTVLSVSPALTGTPTAPTAAPGTNTTQLATTAFVTAAGGSFMGELTLTAVKTANYNAVAGDLVACDVSGGSFTVTLPTAPANNTIIAAMMVKQATSPGALAATTILTVASGGTDVFDIAGGSQTASIPLVNMQQTFIYNSSQGIWSNIMARLGRASLPPTKTVAPTTTYTALAGDILLATAGAGGFTVTLPAVTKNAQVSVKKVDSGAGTITVSPASGTIDGGASFAITGQYQAYTFIADGTNWWVF